jgi:hypothetical protein
MIKLRRLRLTLGPHAGLLLVASGLVLLTLAGCGGKY